MEVIVLDQKRPVIKSWCTDVEPGALEQAFNLARLPFIHKHVALMPDCHQGYGMPIGGVIATKGVVIPNAVGVDIGCGMIAQKVLDWIPDHPALKDILGGVRKVVPVGFHKHKERQDKLLMPPLPLRETPIIREHLGNAAKSLGTLGGGNHFIELQSDGNGALWVMIHSGSRNVGKQVCDFYNKLAKKENERWHTTVPLSHDLAFLPLDTEVAQDYMAEMQWCVDFALANRELMMARVIDQIIERVKKWEYGDYINIAHNYATMEAHFGKNVMIHRKGATLAREGTIGIIPGSQGTSSYIVEGLGNKDSFDSCSHGAGRCMGRKQAQRTLNLEEEQKRLDDRNILHSIRGVKDLDEAPSSYKDIEAVMDAQKDLVEVVTRLEPLAVVKG